MSESMFDYPNACGLCGELPSIHYLHDKQEPWREYAGVIIKCQNHPWRKVCAATRKNAIWLWNKSCSRGGIA